MVGALHQAGDDASLLAYAHGEGPRPSFPVHRVPDFPRARSLRSGPSLAKVALDLRAARTLRRLAGAHGSRRVVAHNVEAALVARLARVPGAVYVAHTRFDAELPTYGVLPGSVAARLGRRLDGWASALGPVAAVAPSLADTLSARLRRPVPALPAPWPPGPRPAPISEAERRAARATLGVSGPALLYAGNLDGYQGWEDAVEAARRVGATLLVATASDPAPLGGRGARLRVLPLGTEGDRRRAHAAADVALVTRRAPGGLPVKLLDALGRGLPVAAPRRALAGLPAAGVVVVADDDPGALASAAERLLASSAERSRLAREGRAYVFEHHAPARFVAAFHGWLAARGRP